MDAGIRKLVHELKDDLLNSDDRPHVNTHPHTSGSIGSDVVLVEKDKYVLLLITLLLYTLHPNVCLSSCRVKQ